LDAFFCGRRSRRLRSSVETRSHEDSGRAEHEGSRQASPVRDAAGGYDGNTGSDFIHDLRNERDGAARGRVTSGFGALRDDDVRAGCDSLPRECNRLDLTNQKRARSFDPLGERRRVAEREHDCCRLALQRQVEQRGLLRQAPRNEADAEALRGSVEHLELAS
jgi:hypothetical protein